jgi:hypothetical protein
LKLYAPQYAEQVVEQFLPGAGDMYCRILQRIPPTFASLVVAIFRWVLTARRPMVITELSTALVLMGFNHPNPLDMT